MLVKICGMKYAENIKQAAMLQPDYLGFIFYKKSKRYFDNQIPKLPQNIKKVGVFVNESTQKIEEIVKTHNLQTIQLHGEETADFCKKIKKILPTTELIKAFPIDKHFNFKQTDLYKTYCDYYLFDTKGKLHGGNGIKFNWDILNNYKEKTPFLLSGGITKKDAKAIKNITHSQFAGIDINSGFETEPALKNIEQLKQFKQNLK